MKQFPLLILTVATLMAITPFFAACAQNTTEKNMNVAMVSGHASLSYYTDKTATINVMINKTGFLYMLYKNSSGKIGLLYPTHDNRQNQVDTATAPKLPVKTTVKVPVSSVAGNDAVMVILSTEKIATLEKELNSNKDFIPVGKAFWDYFCKDGSFAAISNQPQKYTQKATWSSSVMELKIVDRNEKKAGKVDDNKKPAPAIVKNNKTEVVVVNVYPRPLRRPIVYVELGFIWPVPYWVPYDPWIDPYIPVPVPVPVPLPIDPTDPDIDEESEEETVVDDTTEDSSDEPIPDVTDDQPQDEDDPADATDEDDPADATDEDGPADATDEDDPADATDEDDPADATDEENVEDNSSENEPADNYGGNEDSGFDSGDSDSGGFDSGDSDSGDFGGDE